MNSNIEKLPEFIHPLPDKEIKKVKLTENKKEYFKNYYETHKQKLKEYNDSRKNIFVHCNICNCSIVKKHILTHQRTRKHEKNLWNTEPPRTLENKNLIEH